MMMTRIHDRLPCTAVAIAALLAASFSAVAFHDPDFPVMDTLVFEGSSGWAAWRVFVPDGETYGYETYVEGEGVRSVAVGSWLVKDGEWDVDWLGSAHYTGGEDLRLGLPEPVGVVVNEQSGGAEENVWGVGHNGRTSNADQELVIVLAAGARGGDFDTTLRIYASSGVEILSRNQGPAYVFGDEDFGGINAGVRGHATGALYAKAIVDGSIGVEAQGRLAGFFRGTTNSGALEMGYDSPQGSQDGKWLYPLHGAAPGVYDFRIDHHVDSWDSTQWCYLLWGPPCSNYPAVTLLVADVEVPQ